MRILVTGATGYVGGRLVPRLLDAGHEVAVLVRNPRRYAGRRGAEHVEVIEGDLLEPDSIAGKLAGFDAAYYLVHSMLGGAEFGERDRRAAETFAAAIGECPHIVYLGGLLPEGEVSPHLSSRAETGRRLEERLPRRVTEFRAGPIIGSGSASFEMVRYLTERLPVMVTPRWVNNTVQSVAVRDVLNYLVAALDAGPSGIVEIGADVLTFRDMMQIYAEVRGLSRRIIIPTPVLAPRVAARWVGWVTPITNRLAVPLVEGMTRPLAADTEKASRLFPSIEPMSYREAVRRALERVDSNMVETRWTDALGSHVGFELADQEGLIREVRQTEVDATSDAVFATFSGLGGDKGWLVWNWAWTLRGWLDKLTGGPGLRRGRRDPRRLREGESLDFWRVERVEPPHLLRLRAEMKVPGKAWLQFEAAEAESPGKTVLTQTALFEPKGLPGVLYWYLLYPLHAVIFSDMVRAIGREAEHNPSHSAEAAR